MNRRSRFSGAAGILCLLGITAAGAAPLFDQVQLVADAAVAANPVPPAQSFTITQAGSYVVTLTDLQLPTALASLSLAIANPTAMAVTLSGAGSQTVTLATGTYTVQVLALAASGAIGGTFGVQLAPAAGGAVVWQYEDAVGAANPAPSTGQSVLSTKFSVAAAGTYNLSVTDFAFPAALSSLNLIVLNDCGTVVGCVTAPVAPTPGVGPNYSAQLTLTAGTYDLFVVAAADPATLQGLYGIQIVGGSPGTALYANTVSVGLLPAAIPIAVPASGTVSLQLADLAVPAALTSIDGIVTQGATVLQQLSGAGTGSFSAQTGTAQLYVLAQPNSSAGQGAYEVYATAGAQTLADIAQPVLASGQYGYAFPVTLSSAGNYQISVFDFQLPSTLASLTAVVAQGGVALTAAKTTASLAAAAGPLTIIVFPVVPSATANGLFSVQLATQASGVDAFETTQGVGALFSSHTVTVATASSNDLTLSDLGFPASFGTLAVIATRGDSAVGEIFGAGKVTIATTPGTYVLNVLAQVGTGVDYGLYGLQLASTPPAPAVTLTASSNTVTSGKSVTLAWSSTGTSSCSASANPSSSLWAGALPATSGSENSGALTATTMFSISCTGTDGTAGTASVSVSVNPAASRSSGGGGGISLYSLGALLLALTWRLQRRRNST